MKKLLSVLLVLCFITLPLFAGQPEASKAYSDKVKERDVNMLCFWSSVAVTTLGLSFAGSTLDPDTLESKSPVLTALGYGIAGLGTAGSVYFYLEGKKLDKAVSNLQYEVWKLSYSPEIAAAMRSHKVLIGMPESALYLSIGYPTKINRSVFKNYEQNQLVYELDSKTIYVYLRDGKVSGYQD